MYTEQIKRNKGNVFMQMHTMGTSSNLGIMKLGSSLVSIMQQLQKKKQEILRTDDISRLPALFIQFKKQHNNFLDLQKNFFQLDQTTPQTQKLKIRIKDFLQNIKVEEVENKLQGMRKRTIQKQQRQQIKNRIQRNGPGSRLILDDKLTLQQKMLNEQSQQLKVIQKLIVDIKNIAIKTSSLIYEQGVNLNLAAQTIKSARQKFKEGKDQLIGANQYQQDTNRKKLFMCLLVVVIVVVILMVILASSNKN